MKEKSDIMPPIYKDTKYSLEERVTDLVSRMTLEEKISQIVCRAAAIPRLSIPEYDWWNECLHGVAAAGLATVFPQAINMAASFNTNLIRKVADAISDEARAKYHQAVKKTIGVDILASLTLRLILTYSEIRVGAEVRKLMVRIPIYLKNGSVICQGVAR